MKNKQLYKIHITNLRLKAIIGILDFERIKKQKLIVNFHASYDKSIEFVDYSIVVDLIKKMLKKNKYLLLEDAIKSIKKQIKKKNKAIKKMKLEIIKINIIKSARVSVSR